MKPTYLVQCELRNGPRSYVAFVPEEFAMTGTLLRIRKLTGWDEGWTVHDVYLSSRRDASTINGLHAAAKRFERVLK